MASANNEWTRPKTPAVVIGLIASFFLAYLGFVLAPDDVKNFIYFSFSVIPARFDPSSPWAFSAWYEVAGPLLGHVFLHGGWLHLGMNALVLFQAGPLVARRMGAERFLLLFFLSAIGGALAFILINPGAETPAVGASGAICGVFAAYFLSVRPSVRAALRDPMVRRGVFWFLAINVALAALARQSGVLLIAWEAHLGGFLAGGVAFVLLAPRLRSGPWSDFA